MNIRYHSVILQTNISACSIVYLQSSVICICTRYLRKEQIRCINGVFVREAFQDVAGIGKIVATGYGYIDRVRRNIADGTRCNRLGGAKQQCIRTSRNAATISRICFQHVQYAGVRSRWKTSHICGNNIGRRHFQIIESNKSGSRKFKSKAVARFIENSIHNAGSVLGQSNTLQKRSIARFIDKINRKCAGSRMFRFQEIGQTCLISILA